LNEKNNLSLFNKARKRYLGWLRSDKRIEKMYEKEDYLIAYSKHTDYRVERDPYSAVGGMWEEIGELQFEFLVNNSLQPNHKLLDIGCGTLRGGRHFIKYLKAEKYSGIDISPKAIEYGKQLVKQEGLAEKQPRLLVVVELTFKEFDGEIFDYLLAHSVFTHLKPESIYECFQNIGKIMNQDSVFFFTYKEASEFKQTGLKDFCYAFSFFQSLADKYGFNLMNLSGEFVHPRSQRMAMLSKKEE
jgi:SAM-dependent methyltransferase